VTGWTLLPVKNLASDKLTLDYNVTFERLDKEHWSRFVEHPKANELDDYKAYKQLINQTRRKQQNIQKSHRQITQQIGDMVEESPLLGEEFPPTSFLELKNLQLKQSEIRSNEFTGDSDHLHALGMKPVLKRPYHAPFP
jgi:hypothetical protein